MTEQARPMSTSSAEVPLKGLGRPLLVQTARPTPLLEGALLVAIRADPRVSKSHELPGAVPERAPLPTGTADVGQQRRGPPGPRPPSHVQTE